MSDTCHIHSVDYPSHGRCPKCKADRDHPKPRNRSLRHSTADLATRLVSGLDARCRARWERGRALYRKHPDEPFVGDPRDELLAELEDGLNYLNECARQGLITAWAAGELDQKLRDCVHTLAVDVERRKREQSA